MQEIQGIEHLGAPAHKEHIQAVQGREHLRSPAHKEKIQGMQGIQHLRAFLISLIIIIIIPEDAQCREYGGYKGFPQQDSRDDGGDVSAE